MNNPHDPTQHTPWTVEQNVYGKWNVYDSAGLYVFGGSTEALARMVAAGSECEGLKAAIYTAGFGIMWAAGKPSLHCTTEAARKAEEVESDLITENIELRIVGGELYAALKALSRRHGWIPQGGPCVCDEHRQAEDAIAKAAPLLEERK